MHENLYFNDTLTREALERSLAPDEASGAREEAEGRARQQEILELLRRMPDILHKDRETFVTVLTVATAAADLQDAGIGTFFRPSDLPRSESPTGSFRD